MAEIGNAQQQDSDRKGTAAEDHFRVLANAIPHIVWTTDEFGMLDYFNDRWTSFTGSTLDEVRQSGGLDLVFEEDRKIVADTWQKALATGESFETEFRLYCAKKGTYEWFLSRGVPVKNAEGKIERWFGTNTWIEDRRQTLQVLRSLNEIAPSISAELDLKKVVQLVTDSATQLSGAEFGAFFYNVVDEKNESYTLYTLSGVPQDAFSQFPMPRKTAVFGPTFAGSTVVRSDNIKKDPRYGKNAPHAGMPKGHLPVTSYLAVPVISRSGKVLGALFLGHQREGVFTQQSEDIVKGLAAQAAIAMDNARLYQESKDSIRMRDEFLSIASHELRTPLTGMKIQTQMFKRSAAKNPETALEPQRVNKLVTVVDKSIDRLVRLVEDMLDISRIQSGRLAFHMKNLEISSVINEVMERLRPELTAAGIDLSLNLTPNLFASIDRFRIEQVLTNLSTNAIRYAHHQPVAVSLGKLGDHAIIRFKDNGPGIPKEAQDKVFRRFERLISADEISGMGLGLYICKEIIEGHGGVIRLDFDNSPGACFLIDLPLVEGNP